MASNFLPNGRPTGPSSSSKGPMALPIVLLRDKNQELTHEQALLASFAHMAKLMEQSLSEEWGQDWQQPWESWRGGKFRKIVKRANPQRFAGLAQDPQSIHTAIRVGDELIEVLSFPPYRLSDPDPRVKPLQVAGLDYEAQGAFPLGPQSVGIQHNALAAPRTGLVLAYDGALGATTGKMMAQVAHGAQLLKILEPGWSFDSEPVRVVDGFSVEGVDWLLNVTDAGFTEVAPNSNTVRVGRFSS